MYVTSCLLACGASGCLRDGQVCEVDPDCRTTEVCLQGRCTARSGGASDGGASDAGRDASVPGEDAGDAGVPDRSFEVLDEGEILEPVRVLMLSDGRMLATYLVSIGLTEGIDLRVVERDQEGRWGEPTVLLSSDITPYDVAVVERASGARVLLSVQDGDLIAFDRDMGGEWSSGEVVLARGEGLAGVCQAMSASPSTNLGVACVRPRLVDTSSGTPFTPGFLVESASGYAFEQVAPEHDPGPAASYAASVALTEVDGGGLRVFYRRKLDELESSERGLVGDDWGAPERVAALDPGESYTGIATRMGAVLGASGDTWVVHSLAGNINTTRPILRLLTWDAVDGETFDLVLGEAERIQRDPAIDAADSGAVYVTYNSFGDTDGEDGQLRMTVVRGESIQEVVLDGDTGNSLSSSVVVDEAANDVHVVYPRTPGDVGQLVYRRWEPGLN